MNTYRFNVGDIVRVKGYMTVENDDYYPGFVSEMEQYKNKEYAIMDVVTDTVYCLKRTDGSIDKNLGQFYWLNKWLEPLSQRASIEELL